MIPQSDQWECAELSGAFLEGNLAEHRTNFIAEDEQQGFEAHLVGGMP